MNYNQSIFTSSIYFFPLTHHKVLHTLKFWILLLPLPEFKASAKWSGPSVQMRSRMQVKHTGFNGGEGRVLGLGSLWNDMSGVRVCCVTDSNAKGHQGRGDVCQIPATCALTDQKQQNLCNVLNHCVIN